MINPYATAADVRGRWIASSLPPDDTILEKYLYEATLIIDAEYPQLRKQSATDPDLLERLKIVASRMVTRTVQNPDRIRQIQEGAGPFTEGMTYDAATLGDMRLTADDVAILMGGSYRSGKAFTVDTTPQWACDSHSQVCDLRFGAARCSCGSNINGGAGPIFEEAWR